MEIKKSNHHFGSICYLYLLVSFVLVGCGKPEQEKKNDRLVTVSAYGDVGSIRIGFDSAEFELGTKSVETSLEEVEGGIRHKYSIDGYTADLKAERIGNKFFLTVIGIDEVFVNPKNTGYEFIGEDGHDAVRLKPGNKYEVRKRIID